jgi:hypothetical protein
MYRIWYSAGMSGWREDEAYKVYDDSQEAESRAITILQSHSSVNATAMIVEDNEAEDPIEGYFGMIMYLDSLREAIEDV